MVKPTRINKDDAEEIAHLTYLDDVVQLARKLIDLSYRNSYGEIFIDTSVFKELADKLNMTVSDIRPWHR